MGRFWLDIDNPPQAQYLSPIAGSLRDKGHTVLVTSRNDRATLGVLENRGQSATPVGGSFGKSSLSKTAGTLKRAVSLRRLVRHDFGKPDAVVSTSRSGVIAAKLLGSPSFTVLDYEGAELGIFRHFGTILLHPSVVPAERFAERGFPVERLIRFSGMKEDLAFSDLDTARSNPTELPQPRDPSRPAILIRPPSETSHYRTDQSVHVLELVLDFLADRGDLQVVFVPRQAEQSKLLAQRKWKVAPVVISHPIPVVELLGAVDFVVTGGGTMLREAAWLGVPAVTIFQGEMPAVDRWLESEGAIRRVVSRQDLESISWGRTIAEAIVPRHPEALEQVVEIVLKGSARTA